jgi:inner membrane protein
MSKFFRKMGVTSGISALMGVLLFFVHGLVSERSMRRMDAATAIAEQSAGEQTWMGPVLLVNVLVQKAPGALPTPERFYVLPEQALGTATAGIVPRRRGIYEIPSYVLSGTAAGVFAPLRNVLPALAAGESYVRVTSASVATALSDLRGIRGAPELRMGGESRPLARLSDAKVDGLLSAEIPQELLSLDNALPFELALEFEGTRSLHFQMHARLAHVSLYSNWKDPSFSGGALPALRHVSQTGFDATWERNAFSNRLAFSGPLDQAPLGSVDERSTFGVDFVQTVDVYTQTDRATKYGFLFISLTFASLLLFEIIKKREVHAMQYGLVGLAMALFYLMLLSLSEHASFLLAYGSSSAACVGLTGFYLRHVLGGRLRGLGFAALQASLYGVLLVLLRAEEMTLLLGSGLLFTMLGAAMFLTRGIDWHALRPHSAPAAPYAAQTPLCPLHPMVRPSDCTDAPAYR